MFCSFTLLASWRELLFEGYGQFRIEKRKQRCQWPNAISVCTIFLTSNGSVYIVDFIIYVSWPINIINTSESPNTIWINSEEMPKASSEDLESVRPNYIFKNIHVTSIHVTSRKLMDFVMCFVLTSIPRGSRITSPFLLRSLLLITWHCTFTSCKLQSYVYILEWSRDIYISRFLVVAISMS